MDVLVGELAEAGRAALRIGDATTARRVFERALAESESGPVLEGLARARYLAFEFPAAIGDWERAYAAHRDDGDAVGAVRVARTLACVYGTIVGDGAVCRGWLARAQTLLVDAVDSTEAGWVSLNLGLFDGDRARKEEHFREALDVARRWGDTDLEFVTLAYLGASLVHGDATDAGMTLLDEALAAVAGREVDDFCVLEEIFCQLFSACEHAHDVARAEQWIRVGESIARRRNLPAVSAYCRTHYGGILTAAGRWPEAEATLIGAVELWSLGQRSMLRAGALVRLADLRVRQGRLEEAEQLLHGLEVEPEAARPLAAVHLARGETARAEDLLDRALARTDPLSVAAAPLWALLVDVHLREDGPDAVAAAASAAGRLAACADRHGSEYLRAVAALAQGRVCVATGSGDPRACLREALAGFSRARLPMELARSRLELAGVLVARAPEVALAEARAALDGFERLRAARHVDAAVAVLRSLGVRVAPGAAGSRAAVGPEAGSAAGDGPLTRREAEVLDLLGHGLSNPEIADRLFISRKTVEHHVSNILAKLGLRGRAEAAAYAVRLGPPHPAGA